MIARDAPIIAEGEGPIVSLVVAVAANGVIGADGGLPWRIASDMRWFKAVTMGRPMVMGRRTYESIGRALPGRDTVVATHDAAFAADGVSVAATLDEAFDIASACAHLRNIWEVCVIGGAQIYSQTISRAARIYLTRIDADVDGDTVFPPIVAEEWRGVKIASVRADAANEYDCAFYVLDRRAPPLRAAA